MEGGDRSSLESSGEAVEVGDAPRDHDDEGGTFGARGGVGAGSKSGEEDKGGGGDQYEYEGQDKTNYVGNRWPRQETLALLKIRSDMDTVFRDSSLKGPLWEEVSRKLAELGYNRTAKKCKEKFENVYKYHKRTKEGRNGKHEGKAYRFFDQLEAFDHHQHRQHQPSLPISSKPAVFSQALSMVVRPNWTNPTVSTVPSNLHPTNNNTSSPNHEAFISPAIPSNPKVQNNLSRSNNNIPSSFANMSANLFSSSPSSTASDEELGGRSRRKRKWKDFFVKLTKGVIKKQEDLQIKLLEALEKIEHQRIVREDTWKMQEVARVNREHEILVQERSKAAAKDTAVIAFLHKISDQHSPEQPSSALDPPLLPPPPPPLGPPQSRPRQPPALNQAGVHLDIQKVGVRNGDRNASSSRWPKAEVEALIRLRTELELKYQENGPKGPLWEDISAAMRKLGYNRSSKRCKEKWENINKYFKKVKESNKKRHEDSKTCPYFHQLEAMYKEKMVNKSSSDNILCFTNYNQMQQPLMVQPEQQWPLPQGKSSNEEELNREEEEDDDEEEESHDDDIEGEEEEDEDRDSEEEHDEITTFEIVANKQSSMSATME